MDGNRAGNSTCSTCCGLINACFDLDVQVDSQGCVQVLVCPERGTCYGYPANPAYPSPRFPSQEDTTSPTDPLIETTLPNPESINPPATPGYEAKLLTTNSVTYLSHPSHLHTQSELSPQTGRLFERPTNTAHPSLNNLSFTDPNIPVLTSSLPSPRTPRNHITK